MTQSSRSVVAGKAASKPKKPRQDFPLTPRRDGRWAKQVFGKVYIFAGTADDALAEWDRVKTSLYARQTPPEKKEGRTLEDVCDAFLTSKDNRLAAGHLAKRTYDEYKSTCERLGRVLGFSRVASELMPADFEKVRTDISCQWGAIRLGNEIQRIRSIFRFAYEEKLLDSPMQFSSGFKRPSAKILRVERAKKGVRMFERDELHRLLDAAGVQMRCMILLGPNCGYGNADVGLLPPSSIDLKNGWSRFPRPKLALRELVRCGMKRSMRSMPC